MVLAHQKEASREVSCDLASLQSHNIEQYVIDRNNLNCCVVVLRKMGLFLNLPWMEIGIRTCGFIQFSVRANDYNGNAIPTIHSYIVPLV
jgi:hypothetical protein